MIACVLFRGPLMTRAVLFVDGGYLDKIMPRPRGVRYKLDYLKLPQEILSRAGLSCPRDPHYYHCLPYKDSPATHDQDQRFSRKQRFFRALRGALDTTCSLEKPLLMESTKTGDEFTDRRK